MLKEKVIVEEVNQALKKGEESPKLRGILAVTMEPIVSSDIVESAIVDLALTQVVDGDILID